RNCARASRPCPSVQRAHLLLTRFSSIMAMRCATDGRDGGISDWKARQESRPVQVRRSAGPITRKPETSATTGGPSTESEQSRRSSEARWHRNARVAKTSAEKSPERRTRSQPPATRGGIADKTGRKGECLCPATHLGKDRRKSSVASPRRRDASEHHSGRESERVACGLRTAERRPARAR